MQSETEPAPISVRRAGVGLGGGLTWLAKSIESDEESVYRFVASTDDEDRHGDIIEQSTWRLASHAANPVFLYEHGQRSGEQVIGRADAALATTAAPRLEIAVRFHLHELNTNAILAEDQHRTGFRNTVSVGFMPGSSVSRAALPVEDPGFIEGEEYKVGRLYRFCELLEVSSVGIPSNRQAVQIRAHAAEVEDPSEQLARFLKEAHTPRIRQFVLDAIKADEGLRKSVQAMVLGIPRAAPPLAPAPMPWLKS